MIKNFNIDFDTNNESLNKNNESPSQDDKLVYDPIIRNALEYYDKFQPQIQKILDQIEYIKIIDGNNINDKYVFYDRTHKIIFESRIETLSLFVPQNNTWRWSWSVPFTKFTNTYISRKILEYAFTLNSDSDLFLKSTLTNSKVIINSQYQIDIYMALAAMLSKNPFVFRLYLNPLENDGNDEINNSENIYYYKKIINNPGKKNFISVFLLIIDWKE